MNLLKQRSLYEEGLKVLILDCIGISRDKATFEAEEKDLPVWKRGGLDITYK